MRKILVIIFLLLLFYTAFSVIASNHKLDCYDMARAMGYTGEVKIDNLGCQVFDNGEWVDVYAKQTQEAQ